MRKDFGDPDWEFFDQLAEGVPIGVDGAMPRNPGLYPPKVRWTLDEDTDGVEQDVANFKSVTGHEAEVERLFREEARQGWMVELSDEEAKAKYGPNLHVAGLLVVEEKDKIRVVHDGTHGVKVNNRIRVQDQARLQQRGRLGP